MLHLDPAPNCGKLDSVLNCSRAFDFVHLIGFAFNFVYLMGFAFDFVDLIGFVLGFVFLWVPNLISYTRTPHWLVVDIVHLDFVP